MGLSDFLDPRIRLKVFLRVLCPGQVGERGRILPDSTAAAPVRDFGPGENGFASPGGALKNHYLPHCGIGVLKCQSNFVASLSWRLQVLLA